MYHKNIYYFKNFYFNQLLKISKVITSEDIKKTFKIIEKTIKNKKKIFVAGNGGSAAISEHLMVDFFKCIKFDTNFKPMVYSLTNQNYLMSAISNDINFKNVFSYQLDSYASAKDLLIIFSVSGNSQNILEAIKVAQKKKLEIIFVNGKKFEKNKKKYIEINLSEKNFGVTEDIFSCLLHIWSQFFRLKYKNKKMISL